MAPGRSSRRRALIPAAAILAAAAVLPARAAIEINPHGWKFPNILTAAKEAIRVSDRSPAIPGKETMLKGYRRADGTRFQTYEIEGRIFGVEIDTDGKPPFEYSIMDTDGDGRFETRIPHTPDNKDRAYVPKWVVDYYFSRHPELKNPDADVPVPVPSLRVTPPPPETKAASPEPEKHEPPPPAIRNQPNP
ncbi:MAG: hypothetical protein ACRD5D_07305 [Candidatus Polarisedimenticolia bacterium]